MFKEALDLTGIVLTKLDGTAKGGIVLGICDELGVPVRYIGLGERAEDLREFDAEDFVEALVR
jgi:fused signal recognition particle receptor